MIITDTLIALTIFTAAVAIAIILIATSPAKASSDQSNVASNLNLQNLRFTG